MERLSGWWLVPCGALALALATVGGAALAAERWGQEQSSSASRTIDTGALAAYGRLPLGFERNRSQARAGVQFVARGAGYGLALTRNGAILTLRTPAVRSRSLGGSQASKDKEAAMGLRFVGANPTVRLIAGRPLPGTVNYLVGKDPRTWTTGLRRFAEVYYRGLYPGVDARFYGRQGQLEYDLLLAPGADPRRLDLALGGAQAMRVDSRGDLLVKLSGGTLLSRRPFIYQTIAGHRRWVEGGYVLRGDDRFGFRLGAYDRQRRS